MPTLFARRYVRSIGAVGRTERLLGGLILLLLAGILTAFVVHVATDRAYLFEPGAAADREPNSAFPDPGLAGWRSPDRTEHYTPDSLYLKIDGRADAYLKFHVVGLTFGTYLCESGPQQSVDVYSYELPTRTDATAMYESEKPPDAAGVALGRTAYQAGGAVFFCKGLRYVQVLPSLPEETESQAALAIARRLAEQIPE